MLPPFPTYHGCLETSVAGQQASSERTAGAAAGTSSPRLCHAAALAPPASCSTTVAAGTSFSERAVAAVVRGQAGLPAAGGATESGSVPGGRCRDGSPTASPLHHESPRLPCANGAGPDLPPAAEATHGTASTIAMTRPVLTGPSPQVTLLGRGHPTSSQQSILRTARSTEDAESLLRPASPRAYPQPATYVSHSKEC